MQENIIDWLYKPTALNKKLIPVISKELEILYTYVYSLDSTKKDTVACKFDDVNTIKSFCACLDSELQRLKIEIFWSWKGLEKSITSCPTLTDSVGLIFFLFSCWAGPLKISLFSKIDL